STTCTFVQQGGYTVRGRIIDKDGSANDYTTTVQVNNVAPSIGSAAFSSSTVGCGTNNATLQVSFTDPGTADSWSATITWGDGSPAQTVGPVTSPFSVSHTYPSSGPYAASVTVSDTDGGTSAPKAATVNVGY